MVILGANSDDKGKQLESLTRRLLETRGYLQVHTNEVGAGGHELDVTAHYPVAGLGSTRLLKTLCECKAYASPIDTSAWLKFLGKLFVERATVDPQTHGCFIALSGVNGHVWGNYHSLQSSNTTIDLLTGHSLERLVQASFETIPRDSLQRQVTRLSQRPARAIELAYYDQAVYWIILFEEQAYALFEANGSHVAASRARSLSPMVEHAFAAYQFIDLKEEAAALEHRRGLRKQVLCELLLEGGSVQEDTMLTALTAEDFVHTEITDAVTWTTEKGWTRRQNNEIQLVGADGSSPDPNALEMLRFVVTGNVPIAILSTAHYDSMIDAHVLPVLSTLLCNLPLDVQQTTELANLVTWSPTCLAWVLSGETRLSHRLKMPHRDIRMDQMDFKLVLRTLLEKFYQDYQKPQLRDYFLETRGIVEVSRTQHLRVKGHSSVKCEYQVDGRLRIGRMQDEHGERSVLIILADDVPEPWEPMVADEEAGLEALPPIEPPEPAPS